MEILHTKTVPPLEEAIEYALSAFVVYDGIRRYKQFGVSKYMHAAFFKEHARRKGVNINSRSRVQAYLGAQGFTTITTLNFDFARPTPWDVATIMMRYICELTGGEGGAVFCGYAAVALKYIEYIFTDARIVSAYTSMDIGAWLADQSMKEYSRIMPARGSNIINSVLERMRNELHVPRELQNKKIGNDNETNGSNK
jgi:hypothetical protein